ncbi:MAG: hypothetical protein ACYDHF_06335 [Candidatus Cryosericum sp.]
MALSANTPPVFLEGKIQSRPLYQAIHAYEGSLLFKRADGYATTAAGGLPFLGHAYAEADNTSGSSGDLDAYVRSGKYTARVTLSGVAITDVGKEVYASDDGTLTLTATGNSRVGVVDTYVSTNTCLVEFQPLVGSDVVNHEHTAGTDGGKLTSPLIVTGIKDTNGLEILDFGATTDAVNEAKLSNAATGDGPVLEAVGETNVDFTLKPKGTGALKLGLSTGKLALFGGAGAVQQNHIADAKTDYTTGDLDIEAEIIAAINTTNGKINAILAVLEAYEALKTS